MQAPKVNLIREGAWSDITNDGTSEQQGQFATLMA
jgi:hypothetical protein